MQQESNIVPLVLFFNAVIFIAILPFFFLWNASSQVESEAPFRHESPLLLMQRKQDLQTIQKAASLGAVICSDEKHPACSITSICSKAQESDVCEYNVGCFNNSSANTVYICKNGRWVYTDWTKDGYCKFCNTK